MNIPLIDEAAAALKEEGAYRAELSGAQLGEILGQVVAGLLAGQTSVQASVPEMEVRIEKARGMARGRVQVNRPVQAAIHVRAILANDSVPGRIRLVDLDVREEAGFAARLALKAADVAGRARTALGDPNAALFKALSEQLARRGVSLTGLRLQFLEDALEVELSGGRSAG